MEEVKSYNFSYDELKKLSVLASNAYNTAVVVNYFVGYLSGRIRYGEEFNLMKAVKCLREALIFFGLAGSIYFVGILKDMQEGAIQCVSTVVYILIYFYSTNILRNIRQILKEGTPAYKAVDFIYYLLSFEIIKKIPLLDDYLHKADNDVI